MKLEDALDLVDSPRRNMASKAGSSLALLQEAAGMLAAEVHRLRDLLATIDANHATWVPTCACPPPWDQCDHEPLRLTDPGYPVDRLRRS
jgi:hypothetical protein